MGRYHEFYARVLRSATSPTLPPSMAPHVAFVAHVADFYENKIKPHFTPRAGAGGNASTPVKGPDSAYGNVRPATVWAQYNTPCTPDCPTDIAGWQKASERKLSSRSRSSGRARTRMCR